MRLESAYPQIRETDCWFTVELVVAGVPTVIPFQSISAYKKPDSSLALFYGYLGWEFPLLAGSPSSGKVSKRIQGVALFFRVPFRYYS
jgi:hypothetical protein